MTSWEKNSIKNLLALSEEKIAFDIALKEWCFTGNITSYPRATEACKLCEQERLRYHFEIKNNLGNSLLIGSSCIAKFDITVIDEYGVEITEHKEIYLKNLLQKKQITKALDELYQRKPIGKIGSHHVKELDLYCIYKFIDEEEITPKILNYLFKRFEEEKIEYNKEAFRINLNKGENKTQLINLNKVQFDRIEGALNSNQKKIYKKYN